MIGWYKEGVGMEEIGRRLNSAGVFPRYGNRQWNGGKVYELLYKRGVHVVRPMQSDYSYDRMAAYRIAHELRADGRTYGFIVEALDRARLRPLKAARYQVTSVQDLLRSAVFADRSTARGLALHLKDQGHSLRDIGQRLAQAGHFPKRGGQWYPQTVKLLFVS
jgi:hypothetical protein